MRPTVSQYAQALEELSQAAPSEAEMLAKNFLGFLKRRGESEKVGAILDCLEQMETDREKRVAVTAVTAHEVSADMRELLTKKVAALFPGKTVDLSYEVEAAVIGGVRFRSKERLFDATVASELTSLKKILSNT